MVQHTALPVWAQLLTLALCSPIALVLAAVVSSLVSGSLLRSRFISRKVATPLEHREAHAHGHKAANDTCHGVKLAASYFWPLWCMQASRMGTILRLRWRYRHIPGPSPHPLMGNFREVRKHGGLYLAVHHWQKEYGPVFKVFVMHVMFVVTTDPDTAHQFLFRSSTRPSLPTPALDFLPKELALTPEGMVSAKGKYWRMLRNAWQPAFAPGSLVGYTQPMKDSAEQLVDALSHPKGTKPSNRSDPTALHVNGNSAVPDSNGHTGGNTANDQYVNLHELFNSMSLDVVGTCAYGVKFNAVHGSDGQHLPHSGLSSVGPLLKQAITDFGSSTSLQNPVYAVVHSLGTGSLTGWKRTGGTKYGKFAALVPSLTPIIRPIVNLFPDEAFKKLVNSRRRIVDVTSALMNDWRARVQSESGSNGSADLVAHVKMSSNPASVKRAGGLSGIEPGSFLGLLLEAQHKAALNKSSEQLCDRGIARQVNTFLLGGTDTTANALTWAVYYLCQHPDKLERLLQEADAHGRDMPTGPDDEFPYTTAVIHETLRVMPVIPVIGRVVDRPEGIQVGPHKVDCGHNVLSAVWTMHHDPKWWPRVDEFLPERWLPEGEKELGCRNMNAFMPFGGGPRMCIGLKFALQEACIALVTVYKRFTFDMKPGQVPLGRVQGIALAPKQGFWVRPVPRKPHAVTAQ